MHSKIGKFSLPQLHWSRVRSRPALSDLISAIFVLIGSVCYAAPNDFIQEGSIGKASATVATDDEVELPTLEIEQWVGQKFIFLPLNPSLQKFGYQDFRIPYAKWVGQVLTVVTVKKSESYGTHDVTFQHEAGKKFKLSVFQGDVKSIGPLRDLEYAREHWLGKPLWLKKEDLLTFDVLTEKYGAVKLPQTEKVTVKNVVAGGHEDNSVRLILQSDNGEEGYSEVNFSGTNVAKILRRHNKFRDNFYVQDPRTIYKGWSDKVWKAIREKSVFQGMTAAQVTVSLGEPEEKNTTTVGNRRTEQWVYKYGRFLYFENDILNAIQN